MSKLSKPYHIILSIIATIFVTNIALSKVQSRHHPESQFYYDETTPADFTVAEWEKIKGIVSNNKAAGDVQEGYLKASPIDADDEFGFSVSLSNDTLVVGAPGKDNETGSAYVFVRNSGGTWSQSAELTATNSDFGDWFGYSVAIDGETIVVGARNEGSNDINNPASNTSTNSGAIYIFTRVSETWSQQAYLKASNIDANDRFGSSVGISGDTIVVGADGEDGDVGILLENDDMVNINNSKSSSGAAYVFTGSGANWNQQAYLKASNADAGDNFGWSVAISEDNLVVGAVSESSSAVYVGSNNTVNLVGSETNNSADFSGAAYVFNRVGTNWNQQIYLKPTNTEAFDFFGTSVAISGDTLMIAAEGEDSRAFGVTLLGDDFDTSAMANAGNNNVSLDSGAVYVFTLSNPNGWTQRAYIKASNTSAGDNFGYSVSIAGNRMAIGAVSQANEGAVYVFDRKDNTNFVNNWSQNDFIKDSNTSGFDEFGTSVAISPESNISLSEFVAIGAIGEDSGNAADATDNSASRSGAVYVFVDLDLIYKNGFE